MRGDVLRVVLDPAVSVTRSPPRLPRPPLAAQPRLCRPSAPGAVRGRCAPVGEVPPTREGPTTTGGPTAASAIGHPSAAFTTSVGRTSSPQRRLVPMNPASGRRVRMSLVSSSATLRDCELVEEAPREGLLLVLLRGCRLAEGGAVRAAAVLDDVRRTSSSRCGDSVEEGSTSACLRSPTRQAVQGDGPGCGRLSCRRGQGAGSAAAALRRPRGRLPNGTQAKGLLSEDAWSSRIFRLLRRLGRRGRGIREAGTPARR